MLFWFPPLRVFLIPPSCERLAQLYCLLPAPLSSGSTQGKHPINQAPSSLTHAMLQDTTNTAVSAALRKTPRAEGIEAADPEAKVARAETAALAAGDFASDAAPMERLPPPATTAEEGQCAAEAESCAPPCAMEGAHEAAGHDAPEAGELSGAGPTAPGRGDGASASTPPREVCAAAAPEGADA